MKTKEIKEVNIAMKLEIELKMNVEKIEENGDSDMEELERITTVKTIETI